jgi:hypothetical protein
MYRNQKRGMIAGLQHFLLTLIIELMLELFYGHFIRICIKAA